MTKSLLTLALIAAGSLLGAKAESVVYLFDYLGEVDGMADNGRYAAITDPDNGYAYLWDSTRPDDLIDISEISENPESLPSTMIAQGTTAMDVSNDGVVVGSVIYKDGHQHPAYYKDGKWNMLPLDANSMNTNEAVCITPDGKVIAGYQFMRDPEAETGGRYYPCQWFLQDDGTYELKSYTVKLPDHQGFFPQTQSPDGKIVAGRVYCGMGSTVNAMIKDGELVLFDEIVSKEEPWMVKGKYYAGVDEDGKQIWVEDVTDPRVVLFPEVYINGYKDSEVFLEGFFTNCDDEGNLYGARSRVENVTEDGDGDVITEACIYNYLTDTWYTEQGANFFTAGIGDSILFTGNGEVIDGDNIEDVKDAYSIETEYTVEGISKISRDAKTLAGVCSYMNPAIGDLEYYPFIVEIDGGTAGVQGIAGNPRKGLVIARDGSIEVLNAGKVAVYDMNGRLIGTEKVTRVESGVYVVKADDASYKIRVK